PMPYGYIFGDWYLDPNGPDIGPAGQYLQYNAAEARKMVEAAGYDGHEIRIHSPSAAWLQTLEPQIAMLQEAGFNPVIDLMEFSQFVAGPYSGNGPYQATYNNMVGFPTVDETVSSVL